MNFNEKYNFSLNYNTSNHEIRATLLKRAQKKFVEGGLIFFIFTKFLKFCYSI